MIRYPVYQKFNMDTDNKDLQVKLASVFLAQKQREDAVEELQLTQKTLAHFNGKITELVTQASSAIKETDKTPEELTQKVKETLGIDALEIKAKGLNVAISDLDEIETKLRKNLSKELCVQTHSFSIECHDRANDWKNEEQLFLFFDERISALKEEVGADILNVSAVRGEAMTILFRFDPNYQEQVENFILTLTRDICQDYNQYVQNDEHLSQYLDMYTRDGTTEHPFSLYGETGMNLFHKVSNPKFLELNLSELKEAISGDFGVPKNGDIVQYQVMSPHFSIPESHPLKSDINEWYGETFGGRIGEVNVSKDRDGYEKLSKITRDSMFEAYPEITQRAEKVLQSMQLNHRMSKDASLSMP